MSGWFSDVEIDDIPDDPNALPNNTYKFKVTSAVFAKTKTDPSKPDKVIKDGITFKYQIVEGAWSSFFPLVDWVQVPDKNTKADEVSRMLSALKMRLLAFGFTVEEIKDFSPDMVSDCVHKSFYGTTYLRKDAKNGGQTNIKVTTFAPVDADVDLLGDDMDM